MKKLLPRIVIALSLFYFQPTSFGQAPELGAAASFVVFSANGAVTNTGISFCTGNVGTNNGAISGFGNVDGIMHKLDSTSAACANDVQAAYEQLNSATPIFFPLSVLGNGDTLTADFYLINGNGSLNQTLTLDAQGNPNAIFIFQVLGTFSSAASSKVNLINGAKACNIFWKADGPVNLAAGTEMKGTIITNAAIIVEAGVLLEGRVLTTGGSISLNSVTAGMPTGCNGQVLSGPTAPVLGYASCFALFSASGAVTNSGATIVTGDVGTNSGLTTGYDPLKVTGTIHPGPDGSTASCGADVLTLYNQLNSLSYDIQLLYPAQFGNKLVLTPHTYLLNTATTLADTLFLNAGGNTNAVFVIKVNGALLANSFATVLLINGAQAANVFWMINGAANLNNDVDFKGTIVANGAINLGTSARLNGRALTTNGAVNTASISATMPPGCSLNNATYTWIGGSGNWNSATNWSTTNPILIPSGCGANVIIPSGSPVVSTTVSAGNVSISSGINLYVTGLLSVCGNFTGGGDAPAIVSGTGTVVLPGSTLQNISGNTTFSNLQLSNAAGATILPGSTVSITGVYTPTLGTMSTNGGLVLKSLEGGTALIAPGTQNYISGNVTVERYIPARRAWRLLTAPVIANSPQTLLEAWQEGATSSTSNPHPGYGTHITGGATINGFDQSPGNSSSIKYYNGVLTNLPGTKTTTVAQHNGYFIFVRGNRSYNITSTTASTTPTITTLRVAGILNQGTKTITFLNPVAGSFVLAGNPYAAPVNFATLGKTNLKNTFWAWDAQRSGTSLGGYVTVSWDDVEGAYDVDYAPDQTAQTQIIQSGQAVFVQVQNENTATSLTFDETDKSLTSITNGAFRGYGTNNIQQLRIALNRGVGSAGVAVDGALVKFSDGYSAAADDDAVKLNNYDESLSIQRNAAKLSIERRPLIVHTDTIYINIDALKSNATYTFEFNGSNFNNQPLTAFLVDSYTRGETPLSLVEKSIITFKVDGTAASKVANRFIVVFRAASILPVTLSGVNAWQTKQTVQVDWSVQSETGVQRYVVEKSADMMAFTEVSSTVGRNNNASETYNSIDANPFSGDNFYRVKIIQTTGAIKYSNIVKLHFGKGAPSFNVYPNPVKGRKVKLRLVNPPKDAYSLLMYDLSGRQIFKQEIKQRGTEMWREVLLPTSITAGTYYFVLKGDANDASQFRQMVVVE